MRLDVLDNVLGHRLKKAREKKGYSQKDVAKWLGITSSSLSNYERGYRDPDTSILSQLADLYEATADYLLGRDDVKIKVDIAPEKVKTMSEAQRLVDELAQSLNQALADGILTEEQVKLSLDVAKQTMLLMIEAKKNK